MKIKCKKKRTKQASGSTQKFPLSPIVAPESLGWWWLKSGDDWCAAYIFFREASPWYEESMDVAWLRPRGGMSREYYTVGEIANVTWGGRITSVPQY